MGAWHILAFPGCAAGNLYQKNVDRDGREVDKLRLALTR